MSNAVQDAVHTGSGPQSATLPEPIPGTGRDDLPHAYFVEEARLKRAGGTIHHLADHHHTRPEEFQSSACFDAWARDEDAA